ncbi:MAG TPA: DNA replication/repair protein RecF [Acholeplasmatales bacterium]|nr:DNA replication/repair protein RecF [Acholeplasmatales bacterium]
MMFHVRKITLKNFRCYSDFSVEFSPDINIIIGNNAVGKTSLVEAIYCLGLGKSHKTSADADLVKIGENYAFVKAEFTDGDKKDEIVLSFVNGKKKLQHNQKTVGRLSEYVGFMNTVIFSSEDLNLIKGTPADRREFMDSSISQNNKDYLVALIRYRRFLKERNEMLRQTENGKALDEILFDSITEKLNIEATIIINERKRFLDTLNERLNRLNNEISEDKENGKIVYLPNREAGKLAEAFKERRMLDLTLRTTTVGPHRDDFIALINGKDASSFASQGQQRTISLAIKLALAEMCKECNPRLIVILDDVFSELDALRQNQILKLLDQKNQIFITTTSIDNLSESVINNSKVLNISKEEENER